MSIAGLGDISLKELNKELKKGAQFVIFEYTISVIFMTFKRGSGIHFVRAGEGTLLKSFPYTLITLFLGWWGIPWGPIYSVGTMYNNMRGGIDVTSEVAASIRAELRGDYD